MKSTKPIYICIDDSTEIQVILKKNANPNQMNKEERLLFELILKRMLVTTLYDEEKQNGDET